MKHQLGNTPHYNFDTGDRRGFALMATVMVLVLISVLIIAAYSGYMSVQRTSTLDYRNSRVFYAAEAGAEAVMAQLADAMNDGVLADSELANITPPTLTGFVYDTISVIKVDSALIETVTDGPFAGLYALTQKIDIRTEVRDPNDNFAVVIVSAKAQAIPIFQFGIFFEKDLEIHPGPRLDFAGWVHTNGNLYLNSQNAYFEDIVTTPNKVFWDRKDRHDVDNGVRIKDASATDVLLDFDSRIEPTANGFKARSNASFDDRLKTDAYGVDSLRVPLPPGMDPVTIMDPRLVADGSMERSAKFSWKSDFYIEVDLPNIATSGPVDLCANMTVTRFSGLVVPDAVSCEEIFNWNYDLFYEGREDRGADVFDIDMDKLGAWSLGLSTRTPRIIYVSFVNGNPAPTFATDSMSDGFFPVVRLHNGQEVKVGPLTVATDRPVYIKGNFNMVNWVPFAVVGDAITWLSDTWDDANQREYARRAASDTRIEVAILAGHSASACDHEVVGFNCQYGGGVENYPRFLEAWNGGKVMTYYGSLVSLNESRYATGIWANSTNRIPPQTNYYRPPTRDWHFDLRFNNPNNLPPGTPTVGSVIRSAFRPVFQ